MNWVPPGFAEYVVIKGVPYVIIHWEVEYSGPGEPPVITVRMMPVPSTPACPDVTVTTTQAPVVADEPRSTARKLFL